MNFSELQDEVLVIVQDNSTEITSRIPLWVNEAVNIAVEESDVPGFKTMGNVSTEIGQAYASLPANCTGKVMYVGDSNGELNCISFDELLEWHPELNEEGDVIDVAVEGSLIYYQKIPATETSLILLFRRNPVEMVLDVDVPDGIPVLLHRDVIINGAAARGFNFIEDGIEGTKVNTKRYEKEFDKGIIRLAEYAARRRGHVGRSVWRY